MSCLVFLSASRADAEWLDALRSHLAPYRSRGVVAWDERDIPAGARRREAIDATLHAAKIAVLLVSPSYLADEFFVGSELHEWLTAAVGRGLQLRWIPVSASAYKETALDEYPHLHDPRFPLDGLDRADRSRALVAVCERLVGDHVEAAPIAPAAEGPTDGSGEQNRLLEQLADTTARRNELRARGHNTQKEDERILELRKRLRRFDPLSSGETLGDNEQYFLIRELAVGAGATVWLAAERATEGKVAIKVLSPALARDRAQRERFWLCAHTATRLRHEAIVDVLDPQGEDRGQLYYVMEYVDGTSLAQALRGGSVRPEQALAIVSRIGEALAHAHAQRILHGDVGPGSILLDPRGQPRLMGFDLAYAMNGREPRDPRSGPFIAPEFQDLARPVDERADVYGLARTMLAILTAKDPPGDPEDVAAPFGARMVEVLRAATSPLPEARPASIAELCQQLGAAWALRPLHSTSLASASITTSSPAVTSRESASGAPPVVAAQRRRPRPILGWSGVVAALGVVGVLFVKVVLPHLAVEEVTPAPTVAAPIVSAAPPSRRPESPDMERLKSTNAPGVSDMERPEPTNAPGVPDTRPSESATAPVPDTRRDADPPPPEKAVAPRPGGAKKRPLASLQQQFRKLAPALIKTCLSRTSVVDPTAVYVTLHVGPTGTAEVGVESLATALKTCVATELDRHTFLPCVSECDLVRHKLEFGASPP